MRALFILLTLLLTPPMTAETSPILPDERRVDWSRAGLQMRLPVVETVVDMTDRGADPGGATDTAPILQKAIEEFGDADVVLFFPAGTYRFDQRVRIERPGSGGVLIIRGAGADETTLRFQLPDSGWGGLFEVLGAPSQPPQSVEGETPKGTRVVSMALGHAIRPGDWVRFDQENDLEAMRSERLQGESLDRYREALRTWSARAVGQVARVDSVSETSVTLDRPLGLDFTGRDRQLTALAMAERVGFEDFTLENGSEFDGLHTLYFRYAANCWVTGVHSRMTVRAHVDAYDSAHLLIAGCDFDDAYRHGGGGHGYGINLGGRTSAVLVENNRFHRLRHSMMVQMGANSNVFAYNHSFGGTWDHLPDVPPDISVHGHYSFMNLFEGNIVEEGYSSDFWGPAGPGNTFFRNRFTKGGLHIGDNSDFQNALGNESTAPEPWLKVCDSCDAFLAHGNYVDGSVAWAEGLPHDLPPSLHRTAKPDYWHEDLPWPSIGWPVPPFANGIPALEPPRVEDAPAAGTRP